MLLSLVPTVSSSARSLVVLAPTCKGLRRCDRKGGLLFFEACIDFGVFGYLEAAIGYGKQSEIMSDEYM